MAEQRIELGGLPHGVPGPYDTMAGVDTASGEARQFPVPQAGVPRSYPTRASLPAASGFTEGYTVWVRNDPIAANNGDWAVFGGQWVQSADRMTGLEGRVGGIEAEATRNSQRLSVIEPAVKKTPMLPLMVFADAEGNAVGQFDVDGGLRLVGLDGPIQEEIKAIGRRTTTALASVPDDIFAVSDARGAVTLRQSADGSLHLPGLRVSVQEAIAEGGQAIVDTGVAVTRHYRETFTEAALAVAATRAQSSTGAAAPMPFGLMPQRYAPANTWLNQLSTTEPAPIPINTPYRNNDGVVHPNVIEFYNGFRGYRYWMVLTPYYNTGDIYENPVVYGSNDLTQWDMLDGFPQPLAGKPPGTGDHLADCGWAYDPRSGELICYWRATYRNAATTNVTTNESFYRATKDGFTWTEPRTLYPNVGLGDEAQRSLAVLFDPQTSLWHFYATHAVGLVRHRTARHIEGPWSAPIEIPIPGGIVPWHLEVKYVGERAVMLIHDDTTDNLYFGSSADWNTWTFGATPVLSGPLSGVYKASFVPTFNDAGQMAMRIIWTSDQSGATPDDKWRFFVNTTNFATIAGV